MIDRRTELLRKVLLNLNSWSCGFFSVFMCICEAEEKGRTSGERVMASTKDAQPYHVQASHMRGIWAELVQGD